MSIPPLVCSTPPPPDQCEDDRDTEDFDIQYNLSQDEEDDGNSYNYGTYSEYIYTTPTSINTAYTQQGEWSHNISRKTDNELPNNQLEEKNISFNNFPKGDISCINKGFEDVVIEDLNLKLEDHNGESHIEQNVDKFNTSPKNDTSLDPNVNLQVVTENSEDDKVSIISQDLTETIEVNDCIKPLEDNIQPYVEETVANLTVNDAENFFEENIEQCIKKTVKEDSQKLDYGENKKNNLNINNVETENNYMDECLNVTQSSEPSMTVTDQNNKLGDLADDDFGEFDNFRFITSENSPDTAVAFCENPWNSEVSKNGEFGDFTANFDTNDNNFHTSDEKNFEKADDILHNSNDFEDFDDFKSSSNEIKEDLFETQATQNVSVLSLCSPDSEVQIIESINTVLSSIFTSEISENEGEFEEKLDCLLNETWGHLLDTDVRQPYIVNWNNSIGQKSLLKALCIDSRNILFGPKWNNGMPKYAVNLTVAPLQPQKPFTPANITSAEELSVDKTTNKEPGTWTDPFTSDGQEYTYAEALLLDLEHLMATLDQMAHKHSSFKISELLTHACNPDRENNAAVSRPANLDGFNNVYSSTLSVQPIRQINLPDTHIFTPTDSETPRSKTIHYEQGPSVLVPQPSDGDQQPDELISKSKNDVALNNSENDEDYWEFQDFQGSVGSTSSCSKNTMANKSDVSNANNDILPQATFSYETQLLQPIKVEPVVPALNWPNPGEVKETFDDFSEFISNTSWKNENKITSNEFVNHLNSKQEVEFTRNTESLDDEFETFQSAPTSKCIPLDKTLPATANANSHKVLEFTDTNEITHTMHSKTDNSNNLTSKEMLVNQICITGTNNIISSNDGNVKKSPVCTPGTRSFSTSILQPSIAGMSGSQGNHKKTDQILQPLSLESYSQINWPSPGIDLQDLSRFNPVESLQSLKSDSTGSSSKVASPAHKDVNNVRSDVSEEDIWGDFVSSKPKPQQTQPKKLLAFADDDEWTDFVSSPSVKSQNGLNTISLNVHTNLNMQKNSGSSKFHSKSNQLSLDIPALNYVTPKSSSRGLYNDKHFQNL